MHKYKLSRRNIISKSSLCLVALAVTGCQNQSQQQSYSAVNAKFGKNTKIRKCVLPLTKQIEHAEITERNKAAQLKQAQSEMSIAPVLAEIAEEKTKKAWEINMKMVGEMVEASKEGRSINQRRIAEMREEAEMTAGVAREAREDLEKRIERVNAAKKALEAASGTRKKLCIAKKKAQEEERMARKKREEWEAKMKAENERIAAVVTEAKIKTKEEMKMIAGEEMKRQGLTEMGVAATEEAVQKMLNKPNLPIKTAKKISGCLFKVFKKIFHKKEQQQLGLGTRS